MAAEYGFTIEKHTEALIRTHSQLISQVAAERVREELCRLLSTENAARYLYYLDQLGLLTTIIPELDLTKGVEQPIEHHWDVFDHSIETVAAFERIIQHSSSGQEDPILSHLPHIPGMHQHLEEEVACDVVVSGPKGPRERVMELCGLVPGLRAVDGGPLSNARIVESITALLIGLNIRYKVPEGLGIRFTGLPEA